MCLIIVQIICEFVENSFEHGYRSTPGDGIDVEATLDDDGMVHATVTDRGQWKTPSADPGMRGRGLMLADALATESRVVGSDTGTTASITHRLSRPARIVTDPNVAPVAERTNAPEFSAAVVEDGFLVITGDVDNETAAVSGGTDLASKPLRHFSFEPRPVAGDAYGVGWSASLGRSVGALATA